MILALDYGTKNIGVAISDSSLKIALIQQKIKTSDIKMYLKNILETKHIKTILIGYPLKNDNQQSYISKKVITFSQKLQSDFPNINIILINETMTTQIALKNLHQQGYNKKQILEMKDSESARILLQEYLDNAK